MKTKRLLAAAVAGAIGIGGLLASAAPASAWTKRDCEKTWAEGKDHPHCGKYKTTTTEKAEKTTTTEAKRSTTTTTVVVKPEVVKPPAAVKVTPKFTG